MRGRDDAGRLPTVTTAATSLLAAGELNQWRLYA